MQDLGKIPSAGSVKVPDQAEYVGQAEDEAAEEARKAAEERARATMSGEAGGFGGPVAPTGVPVRGMDVDLPSIYETPVTIPNMEALALKEGISATVKIFVPHVGGGPLVLIDMFGNAMWQPIQNLPSQLISQLAAFQSQPKAGE